MLPGKDCKLVLTPNDVKIILTSYFKEADVNLDEIYFDVTENEESIHELTGVLCIGKVAG